MSMAGLFYLISIDDRSKSDCVKKEEKEMAVRQYIGARYVPKYFENPDGSNDWLEGITYEPLTIVTYAGVQFISKIPVPVNIGSPNLNTKYWIITNSGGGGSISQETLEKVNQNTSDISQLQVDVTKNTNDISNVETELNGVKEKVDTINVKNKKYIFITDSYGTFYYSGKNFVEIMANNAGLKSDMYLNLTNPGGGFSKTDSTNFTTFLMGQNIENKEDYTDIWVLSGANDMVSSDVSGGINTFCNYVKENFQNATVSIGFVSKDFRLPAYTNFANTYNAYSNCGIFGAKYLSNTECIMNFKSMFDTDLIHPTTNAVLEIGNRLTQWLLTGEGNVIKSININVACNAWSNINQHMRWVQNNQNVALVGTYNYLFMCLFDANVGLHTNYNLTINDIPFPTESYPNVPIVVYGKISEGFAPALGALYPNKITNGICNMVLQVYGISELTGASLLNSGFVSIIP